MSFLSDLGISETSIERISERVSGARAKLGEPFFARRLEVISATEAQAIVRAKCNLRFGKFSAILGDRLLISFTKSPKPGDIHVFETVNEPGSLSYCTFGGTEAPNGWQEYAVITRTKRRKLATGAQKSRGAA